MQTQRMTWYRLLTASVLLVCLTAAMAQAEAGEHSDKQNVVVHLSSYTDDLHAVNMALKIGTMLVEGGAKVTLFIDLEGVRLADSRSPQNLRWGNAAPVTDLYARFVEVGGKVLVCPHCAKVAGITADDLRKGATIATHDELQATMLTADKVIDY